MAKKLKRSAASRKFNAQEFLDSSGVKRAIAKYPGRRVIFSQGDPATDVLYIQDGEVKLSVLSKTGREAVIAMLGPGDSFGEIALLRKVPRTASVVAVGQVEAFALDRDAFCAAVTGDLRSSRAAQDVVEHRLAGTQHSADE